MEKKTYEATLYSSVLPDYREGREAYGQSRPFFHTDLKEGLEKVVLREEPEKKEGIVDRIFSDKGKTLKGTIKALFSEIQLRERLDTFLVYKIDEDATEQKSQLAHLSSLRTHYNPELHKDTTKTRKQLESNVLELEREKRTEYLECWRDLMFMKKYLLTALKDYWDLSKKRNMLAYDFNKFAQNENIKGYRGAMQKA